ncbi:MAG: TonB-dependent receptor [Nitrospirae bacterium]|nr:TonB-dependent receptor [Nitrospirota bacterium]MCL5977230.1 TonB-dependent receptor [Nitrospirota bacterium]
MRSKFCMTVLLALLIALSQLVWAEEKERVTTLEPIVVVGEKVELFTGKVPEERIDELQPVDIGDLLKKDVEGLGAIRRTGLAFDPILRGLTKDRLSVLVNGGFLYGACANRMDPPTFHITPYGVAGVEVIRGPFDVTRGPGSLGGMINIKMKEPKYYEKLEFHPEIRAGFDGVSNGMKGGLTIQGGKAPFGFNLSYDYKDYDGYKDGNGKRITTDFRQSNFTAGINYFIDKNKKIGFDYMGQRAKDVFYPTLAMDSPKDNMDMVAVNMDLKNLSNTLTRLEARIYSSWVDHMMDNYSKFIYTNPTPTMKMEAPSESRTYGGKIKATLDFMDETDIGVDYYNRWWDIILKRRTLAGVRQADIRAIPDTTITDFGIFAQPKKKFGNFTLTAGARADLVNAEAKAVGATERGYFDTYYGTGTSLNLDKSETNIGCFLRGNYNIIKGVDLYAGVGRGVRTADPRERFRVLLPIPGGKWDIGNPNLKPEASLQYELGNKGKIGKFNYNLSIFHNTIDNYITQFDTGKTFSGQPVMGYKNVDATLYGGELSAGFLVTDKISLLGSASYTWGENKTENKSLPEIMPLQGRLGVRYDDISGKLWAELMGRFVASQHRYDPVVDPGITNGFSTFDLRLGWKLKGNILITAGVENLLNRYYYEHTSKNFAFNQDGYKTTDRIPEPGRNVYMNLTMSF